MTAAISKQEYLKRYLEGGQEKSKQRKIKKRPHISRFKIVDGDIDIKSINFNNNDDEIEEDVPVIAEIIDERPEEVKIKEQFESSRWKKFNSIDNDDGVPMNDHVLSNLRRRYDSDSDASLPRPGQRNEPHDNDSDASPPRRPIKQEKISDDDNSPPRKYNRKDYDIKSYHTGSSKSPVSSNRGKLHKSRHDSDSDNSVERLLISHTHSSRHSKQSEHYSYDKKFKTANRQNTNRADSDNSPPRINERHKESVKKKSDRTLSGLKAGLQNAATLKEESKDLRLREKKKIVEMNEELSGRNAETVLRDRRTGLKRDLAEEKRIKDIEEQKVVEYQQKYAKWGKGIEQAEKMKSNVSNDLYEMSKPLARYCDDDDLDENLKAAEREGDTMAAYIRKKKKLAPSVPQYNGPAPPPNRFGIPPGYRWDGVDRSNGFEKKYFEKINKSKATESEAYLWSVQNM